MRRVLIGLAVVFVSIAATSTAAAQDVSWGVKGGLVFASLDASGSGDSGTNAGTGGAAGGFVAIDFSQRIRIQPELLVSWRRFEVTAADVPFDITAASFEVPLLVHVAFAANQRSRAFVFAGPQFGVIADVQQTLGQTTTDISDLVKDYDVGIAFGAAVEVAFTRGALILEVRGNFGFRDLSETPPPVLKSRAVFALVGLRL